MADFNYQNLKYGKIGNRELNEYLQHELNTSVRYVFESEEPPSDIKDGMLWYNPRTRCAKLCYLGTFRDIVLPAPDRDRKTVVFVIGGVPLEGMQEKYISFPYDGIIKRARACCVTPSEEGDTSISIQKTSRDRLAEEEWEQVLERNLLIEKDSLVDDDNSTLATKDISKGEYLRVSIDSLSEGIKNITVELDIEIGI